MSIFALQVRCQTIPGRGHKLSPKGTVINGGGGRGGDCETGPLLHWLTVTLSFGAVRVITASSRPLTGGPPRGSNKAIIISTIKMFYICSSTLSGPLTWENGATSLMMVYISRPVCYAADKVIVFSFGGRLEVVEQWELGILQIIIRTVFWV